MQMKKNVNHDSSDSKRGDFYQSLIAIFYAVSIPELFKFDKLTIEHEGDVSFDNFVQIETKHHKSANSLSDTSEEFWKTLYNWLNQNTDFQKLILHTTSHLPRGKKQLRNWNDSTTEERIKILNKIDFCFKLDDIDKYQFSKINLEIISNLNIRSDVVEKLTKFKKKKYLKAELEKLLIGQKLKDREVELILKECKDTSENKYKNWNYSRFVKSCSDTKLREIVSKITIESSQKNDSETILEISDSPTFKGVCKSQNDFDILIREKLAGAIASKVVGEKSWELSSDQFYTILNDAKSNFYKENYRPIFDKYLSKEPTEEQLELNSEKQFLKELTLISCEPDEIKEATVDYWKTNTLIVEELDSNPLFVKEESVPYKEKIVLPKIINNKRKYTPNGDLHDNLKTSLRFYRDAKDLTFPDHLGIRSLPYFSHGTMHNIVEDENDNFNWIIND